MLGVRFTDKLNDDSMLVYCVYLPPDNSKYSEFNEEILNNLTIEAYREQECDNLFICGDFNARIGDRNDCLEIDCTPMRQVVDKTVNKQGEKLLTFVKDIRSCVINGRVTSHLDDYTLVTSYRGSAVVDYHLTRQTDLNSVTEFKVLNTLDAIEKLNLHSTIREGNRPPDHGLLSMTIELSSILTDEIRQGGNTLGSKNYRQRGQIWRTVDKQYMASDTAKRMLPILIENLLDMQAEQSSLNETYDELVNFVLEEAERSRGPKSRNRRAGTKFKEYWDSELTAQWNKIREYERLYLTAKRSKGLSEEKQHRLDFNAAKDCLIRH